MAAKESVLCHPRLVEPHIWVPAARLCANNSRFAGAAVVGLVSLVTSTPSAAVPSIDGSDRCHIENLAMQSGRDYKLVSLAGVGVTGGVSTQRTWLSCVLTPTSRHTSPYHQHSIATRLCSGCQALGGKTGSFKSSPCQGHVALSLITEAVIDRITVSQPS